MIKTTQVAAKHVRTPAYTRVTGVAISAIEGGVARLHGSSTTNSGQGRGVFVRRDAATPRTTCRAGSLQNAETHELHASTFGTTTTDGRKTLPYGSSTGRLQPCVELRRTEGQEERKEIELRELTGMS